MFKWQRTFFDFYQLSDEPTLSPYKYSPAEQYSSVPVTCVLLNNVGRLDGYVGV